MSLMSIRKINNIPYEINEQLNDVNECQHRNEHSTRHDEIRHDNFRTPLESNGGAGYIANYVN